MHDNMLIFIPRNQALKALQSVEGLQDLVNMHKYLEVAFSQYKSILGYGDKSERKWHRGKEFLVHLNIQAVDSAFSEDGEYICNCIRHLFETYDIETALESTELWRYPRAGIPVSRLVRFIQKSLPLKRLNKPDAKVSQWCSENSDRILAAYDKWFNKTLRSEKSEYLDRYPIWRWPQAYPH